MIFILGKVLERICVIVGMYGRFLMIFIRGMIL